MADGSLKDTRVIEPNIQNVSEVGHMKLSQLKTRGRWLYAKTVLLHRL